MTLTIFIVDTHEAVRTALRQWLEAEFPLYQMIELISAEGALARACFQAPDLIIMDMGFSLNDSIAVMSRLQALVPNVPVVILTMFDDDEHRARAREAGAAAFISTRTMHDELIPLLTTLLSRVQA